MKYYLFVLTNAKSIYLGLNVPQYNQDSMRVASVEVLSIKSMLYGVVLSKGVLTFREGA